MLIEARKLLNSAERVAQTAKANQPRIETLKVAAGDFILDQILRPALPAYHQLENVPDIELISVNPGKAMVSMLDEGLADVGFFTGARPKEPSLRVERLCMVSVGLYAAPSLANSLSDLDNVPMIMAAQGSPTDSWFLQVLSALGIHPRHIAARSQYPDVILELVCQGKGLGLLFDDMAKPHVATGRLLRLPHHVPPSHRYLVTGRRFTDTGVLKSIAFLRKLVRTPAP